MSCFFSFCFIKLSEPNVQKHCGLVSQRRVQNKWKECFKYLRYFHTEMQDWPKFGLFQNHSFQKERPNYFQIIWNMLFHNQISNFGGIILVLLMQMRGFPSGLDGKLKSNRSYVSRI